uniref:Serpentine receptor class gamma n=2 Tax=Caenorhabditis tropicalis TaxID=1561998 RepID=A0A1I7TRS1_9PELO
MDFFSQKSSRDISFQEMDRTTQALLAVVAIFQVTCFTYNVLFLIATYKNRRSNFLPISYMTVMSIAGILVTAFMTWNQLVYISVLHRLELTG